MERIRGRPRAPQQPAQPRVPGQHADVFDTLPARGLHQDDRVEPVELGIPAPPASHAQVAADQLVEAEGEHRLRHQRQPRVGRQIHWPGGGFEDKRQDTLTHVAGFSPPSTDGYDTPPGRPSPNERAARSALSGAWRA